MEHEFKLGDPLYSVTWCDYREDWIDTVYLVEDLTPEIVVYRKATGCDCHGWTLEPRTDMNDTESNFQQHRNRRTVIISPLKPSVAKVTLADALLYAIDQQQRKIHGLQRDLKTLKQRIQDES